MKKLLFTVVILVVSIFGAPGLAAAADFNVSVVNFAYTINGQANFPTLTLTRGKSYTFVNIDGSGFIHPFGIQTLPTTQGGSLYGVGISGDAPLVNGTMTFNVPAGAPSTLYYNCQNHNFMFGQIDIVSAPTAAAVPAVPDVARAVLAVGLAALGVALAGRVLKRHELPEPPAV